MNIVFRRAIPEDLEQIKDLLHKSFGFEEYTTALNIFGNSYWVAEDDGIIVAITGIVDNEFCNYVNGYEITWTCTAKEYRRKGIMTDLLRIVINNDRFEDKPIYCSAWRFKGKEINLKSILKELGFELLYEGRTYYKYPLYKVCEVCVEGKDGCVCYEDLYVLRDFEKFV